MKSSQLKSGNLMLKKFMCFKEPHLGCRMQSAKPSEISLFGSLWCQIQLAFLQRRPQLHQLLAERLPAGCLSVFNGVWDDLGKIMEEKNYTCLLCFDMFWRNSTASAPGTSHHSHDLRHSILLTKMLRHSILLVPNLRHWGIASHLWFSSTAH